MQKRTRVKTVAITVILFSLLLAGWVYATRETELASKTDKYNKVAVVQEPTPNKVNSVQDTDEPTTVVYNGKYSNCVFEFTVNIPNGFQGISSPPPTPQHGFLVTLSERDDATLAVTANYNSLFWKSVEESLNSTIQSLKDRSDDFKVESKESYPFKELKGFHFVIKYIDKKSNQNMMLEKITFLHKTNEDDEIVYEVTLETPEIRYKEDKEVFDQMIQTWSLCKNKRCCDNS